MAGRTSRSASLHVPSTSPSSSSRIEEVLNLYNVQPRPTRGGRPSLDTPGASPVLTPSSRPTSRASANFLPRIVRGSADREPATSSSLPSSRHSISPSRSRRPSSSAVQHPPSMRLRTPSASAITPVTPPPSFPQPAYLAHSAFRHLIKSEEPFTQPSNRYRLEGLANEAARKSPADSDEEGGVIGRSGGSSQVRNSSAEQVLRLPTRWSEQDRCPLVTVSLDGRELKFAGPSSQIDRDSAAARTNHPIPPACGIYYYEVKVLDKGARGHISIGFVRGDVPLTRLPGWERHSWGYHGDDGQSFASQQDGTPYGPKFTVGDVIGCGIDFSQKRAFYTKNGHFLGLVFDDIVGNDLYPCVGLRTQQESIRANFGQEPFMFDIDSHVEQEQSRTWQRIQSTTVQWSGNTLSRRPDPPPVAEGEEPLPPPPEDIGSPMNELIIAYLSHHGYAETAKALKGRREDMKTEAEEQDDIKTRQKIANAIRRGDIDTALEVTKRHYPSVLEQDGGFMHFKLRCRKFVELVLYSYEILKRGREEESRLASNASMNGSTAMEIDPLTNGTVSTAKSLKEKYKSPAALKSQEALTEALTYGQALQADYRLDPRPAIQTIFKRTFSLVAYENPMEHPQAAEYVGQKARDELVDELNRAILHSRGKPDTPALEQLYRQAATVLHHLGKMGVGAAAFADMEKELRES